MLIILNQTMLSLCRELCLMPHKASAEHVLLINVLCFRAR
uniref:Uncharacterized protein n=1 Tax=Arundo donax TaxID=35708 RepID=A0A0A9AXT8_ARUDO